MKCQLFSFLIILIGCLSNINADNSLEEENDLSANRYTIEGRIFPLSDYTVTQPHWQANTRIHVNGGEFIGFVKKDGSFVIHNLPPGSYVVEILNPEYNFEPARVEINSKGKYRARKVNHIKTSEVIVVPYPLKMKALGTCTSNLYLHKFTDH